MNSRPLAVLAAAVLVVGALYFARPVLIPIALAILLAFLLGPIVDWLQRRGLGSTPSVGIVVISSLALVAALLAGLWMQVDALAEELPNYKANIIDKVRTVRAAQDGPFSDVAQDAMQEIAGELKDPEEEETASVPVRIEEEKSPLVTGLSTVAAFLASAGLVIVLVLFLLLGRRALRDRLIFLFGQRHLTVTTKALDEAATRISRYLLMQAMVNGGFGLAVGIALFALGVDYALLWGFFAAVLRFIPYLGPWLAAAMPLALSLALFPGWTRPLVVIGVYLLLELTFNMLVEPLVYGKSVGVSEVALLVAIAFWTWLWGPIGLILATPMTVCLVVLGKYVPGFKFIALLMGDEPIADAQVRFYQRILAGDEDEAMELVEDVREEHGPDAVSDRLLLPALSATKRDMRLGALDAADTAAVLVSLRIVVDMLENGAPTPAEAPEERPLVLGYPASDESDRTGLQILQGLLRRTRTCELEVLGRGVLVSELLDRIARDHPRAVCVGSLAPGGFSRALHVCKRLRAHYPGLRILVGRWTGPADQAVRLTDAGADRVALTLLETRNEIQSLVKLAPADPRAAASPRAEAV
jgi:predicted PurR-regulated permease PerM